MGHEKDVVKFLKLHWRVAVLVFISLFVIFAISPAFFIHRSKEWQNFAAWSTWFYALTALFTLFVILGAAILTLQQLSEIKKARQLDIVFELSRAYYTKEMHAALYSVLHSNIDEHSLNVFYKHVVLDFWNNRVAWAVLEGLIEIRFIKERFEEDIKEVWEKLRPTELQLRFTYEHHELIKLRKAGQRYSEVWEDEKRRAQERAEYYVDYVMPLGKLYRMLHELDLDK